MGKKNDKPNVTETGWATTSDAPPVPPAPPELSNRQASGVFVRNITRGPVCEFPDGERTVIEPGRIARLAEDRIPALAGLVEVVTEDDYAAQQAADAKNKA